MHCFSYMIQIRKTLEHICDKISSSVILLIRTSALPLFSLVSSSIVKKKRKKKRFGIFDLGCFTARNTRGSIHHA